ncbi:MAG: response regulator [Anaerolineales bacterium]|nr:response regulator [Anaerolineales bacterium]
MPKKQKIDKRLDKLFDNLTPEETASGTKSKARVRKEAPPLSAPEPVQPIQNAVSTPEPSKPASKEISTPATAPEPISIPAAPPTPTSSPTPSPEPVAATTSIPTQPATKVETAPRPAKRQTSMLPPLPETVLVQETTSANTSGFAINFQTGNQDWATLKVEDDTQREWTTDEQLLVRQVTDQLALALENARLFQETQEALETTKARAEAENLINDIATAFLNVNDPTKINNEINHSLGRIGKFLNIDRSSIFIFNEDGITMENTHEWHDEGVESYIEDFHNVPRSSLPYMMKFMNRMEPFVVSNVAELPEEAHVDRNEYHRKKVQSTMSVPVVLQNQTVGFINLDSVERIRIWREEDVTTLRLFGQIAISALERAKDQSALTKSEADLRALFSSMEDVVFVVDKDGRYVRIAPTNPALLVRPPDELLGQLMRDVVSPKETADRFLSAIQETLEKNEAVQLEYELPVAGEVYWFLANLTKLDQDNVFWVARDITERKKSEEAIRRRNEYLAVSAEIGKLVTSTLDLNSIFTRTVKLISERFSLYHVAIFIVEETGFNAALREATGIAGEEMKKNRHMVIVNNESIVGKVTTNGQAVVVNDVLKDPIYKFNPLLPETKSEAAIPLRIGNRTIGAVDIQSKIVDAFTEDEISVLQTLADQIAIAIDNARSFELSQEAVKEMREIDRVKSQFLANMSHELRTPLNSIIGFSRVILKGIDGPVTELQQQDLSAIYNSGQHLLSLINDILDLAKIEAGKMELAFDEVNMADVTNSVISTMSGLVKDKPIELKRIIEPDLPTVRADAIRVRQVMINLLSNAAKFTDEGDITINVGVRPGPTGRLELQVNVTDSGTGISKEDQAKLFQAFSQVDDSPTRKTGGTGLGLSICQHLISMHGGRIWVESEVGHGSTFSFTLPIYRKEREIDIAAPGSRIILAIDDDPQVIGLYERYLQPQGYQVVALTDPSRAVERIKQLKPFAITLDIMMPGIDGWQVLDQIKGDAETRNTPVIVCSIIEDLEKGYSLGASDYLVKPILEDDLVNSLDRLNADGSIRDVLVIDDDPNDLRLIAKILTDDGRYKATLAEGGPSGWTIISSGNPPHAVIMDLFMPDMDGFKILENMRANETLRDIPVIVISGMDLTAEQKEELNKFGQRLLSKGSFNEKELLTTIQRALERVGPK